jgi:OOP family OmpA-OmpF porin
MYRSTLTLIAIAVMATASGCATRGFVRNEVATMNGRLGAVETSADAAGTNAQRAYDLAKSGDDRARLAEYQAQVARDLALGNIRREEVRGETVLFAFDSAKLTDEAKATLDGVAAEVRANPNYMVLISGYTDATGTDDYNRGLAARRSSAVHMYLAEQLGSDFVRVAQIGFGEILPVADNGSSDGRRQNRRAEVSIVKPVPAGTAQQPPPAMTKDKPEEKPASDPVL